jgi:hypothetical protein
MLIKILCLVLFSFSLQAVEVTPYKGNKKVDKTFTLCAMSAFRDEAEWMKEWIEFHKLVGVEHFYLYNNAGKDNYLEVLAPYIKSGEVELFDYPKEDFHNQDHIDLLNHALEYARGKTEWIALIDSDEYLVPMRGNDIKEELLLLKNFPGVQVRWCTYGTSNVWTLKKGELLIEKLLHRAPLENPLNKYYKSIVQPDLTRVMKNHHTAGYVPNLFPKNIERDVLRIHHYIARTQKFLKEVKEPRTKHWNQGNPFKRRSLSEYMKVANEVYDDEMLRFVPALKEVL